MFGLLDLLVLRHSQHSCRQGKLEEADPLLVRAIEIQENALGPDHPSLANSLGTRAMVLQAQVWEYFPGDISIRGSDTHRVFRGTSVSNISNGRMLATIALLMLNLLLWF